MLVTIHSATICKVILEEYTNLNKATPLSPLKCWQLAAAPLEKM